MHFKKEWRNNIMVSRRRAVYFLIGVKFKLVHQAALKYNTLEFCFTPSFDVLA